MSTQIPPILVTGHHYSGSSWLGSMIAQAPRVAYIHEPFNIRHRPGVCAARFDRWYTYICDRNGAGYEADIRKTLEFRYGYLAEAVSMRRMRDAGRFLRDASNFARWRLFNYQPMMKDPIALLAADWLARTFQMKVVVVLRHPAAFAASVKRRKARPPFQHLLDQPLLMQDLLGDSQDKIAQFAAGEEDLVTEAAFLWRLLAECVIAFQRRNPDWIVIRHEDLASEPLTKLEPIFRRLGLEFTPAVRNAIRTTTSERNPVEKNSVEHNVRRSTYIRRDSRRLIHKWRSQLSADEIAAVRNQTEDLAKEWYSDSDWETHEYDEPTRAA